MSRVSGKMRTMERRQATMEDLLKKVNETQDFHSRQMLLLRLQQRQGNKYMRMLHEHLMGSKKRHGVFARLRTLEIQHKVIITVASLVTSALIIGFLKAVL